MKKQTPRHLGQVMTEAEANKLITVILGLEGTSIQERACAIASGWPLGDGPTMAEGTEARWEQLHGQQKGLDHG